MEEQERLVLPAVCRRSRQLCRRQADLREEHIAVRIHHIGIVRCALHTAVDGRRQKALQVDLKNQECQRTLGIRRDLCHQEQLLPGCLTSQRHGAVFRLLKEPKEILMPAVGDQAGGSDPHILHRGEEESAIHEIVGPREIVQSAADIGVPLHIQRPWTHRKVHHGRGQREVSRPALHILQQILHDLIVLLHHAERDLAQLLLRAVRVDGENAHTHQEQRDQGTGDAFFQCLSEDGILSAGPQVMYLFLHGLPPALSYFSSAVRPRQPDCAFFNQTLMYLPLFFAQL